MDQKAESGPFKGKTLLQLCQHPMKVDPADLGHLLRRRPGTRPGALPFRVWQGFELMVDSLRKGDLLTFLCAAGCMAHYVGDACQPLHVSRLHHGNPENATSTTKKVHSTYETDMLNVPVNAKAIVDGMVTAPGSKSVQGSFQGGHGAALRVVRLMTETIQALHPSDIVKAYNEETRAGRSRGALWKDGAGPPARPTGRAAGAAPDHRRRRDLRFRDRSLAPDSKPASTHGMDRGAARTR